MQKILLYLIYLTFLFIIGCSKKYEKTSFYESGELKERYVYSSKSDYASNLNYDAYLYYKNGELKNFTTVREGKNEGKYLNYYENGRIKRITNFSNGKKHGIDKYFTSNGELAEEGFYLNDIHLIKMKVFF